MKKINKILVFMACLIIVLSVKINVVRAEEALGFTYENTLPKNQIGAATYFELKVKPGDKQTLVTTLTNQTDKKKVIQINISNATTSSAGNINYGPSKEKLIGEKTEEIAKMLEAPSRVTLKPHESKKVELKLTVPKEEFDGIALGGVQLKEVSENKTEEVKEGTSLKNEYSYIFSVSVKETDKKIAPKVTSSGAQYNGMAYVILNNVQPIITSKVKINTVLMKKDSDKIIDEFKVVDYRLAPNSVLSLPLQGTEELELGKYRTQTTVEVENKTWNFEGEFEVTKENKQKKDTLIDETSEEKGLNWLVIGLVCISFALTVAIIYVVLSKKNKFKRNKK
ncbi:WxL protein peptidoglycan domain-containing protein [Vagococcus carniphilus]|uniref:DUF916 domain-containing protein n=1 Tax=Vagococcus carniphilus TaxID=218144 RepID=UPI003B5C2AE4